ncbi:hypothetical protein Tco_0545199, partial [Tanacetum coccineum]
TSPSEITSEIPMEVEGFEPPQEEEIPIRRSESTQSNKWIDAMNAEIQSMLDNMVWVLVNLPPGCKNVGKKYARSIYGLKQASRSWNKRFDEEIKRFGFAQNLDEPWKATFILGIKIYRDRSKRLIGLSQNAYIDKILKRYKMDNSKRGYIPMQERLDLNKTQGASTPEEVKRMQNVPYALVVGSIMCAYLRNTKDMFLVYGGNLEAELQVNCYCNAGFEIDIDDMKSLTGYVSF